MSTAKPVDTTLSEDDTECCYALQDKVWVQGPGTEPWELYVVKGDADHLDKAADSECCGGIQDDNAEKLAGSASSTTSCW